MPNSQREISLQMLAQLRLLDPSASAEVGTPERKIIDTVGSAIHDNQIDLTLLQGQLDFNAKFGQNLDRFFSLFRFNRQGASFSEGYVTFGRLVPATLDIRIPAGTLVMAPTPEATPTSESTNLEAGSVVFQTTLDAYLRAGTTSVVAPIRATTPGSSGRISAGRITTFVSEPVLGITTVTNATPTTGGVDQESDDEFKVRFKNTVFRNLAGTQDQYLALALALQFASKANVVGPLSRYREYIQVPGGTDNLLGGNGNAGEYTTALSTLPYAKHIWEDIPHFVSNGDLGPGAVFYRHETDFRLNTLTADTNRGDAYRLFTGGLGDNPLESPNRPNVSFLNIYTGTDADVQAVRPSDVVLLEYGYMSEVSRNDYDRRILNCVDVFVDGVSELQASANIPRPTVNHLFVDNPLSKHHYDNYRRVGEATHRPVLGNAFTPLFWQPVLSVPESIEIESGEQTYVFTRGTHYWMVEDVSEFYGTVRARNGIEWSTGVGAQGEGDDDAGPYTGPYITELNSDVTVPILEYTYDRNTVDLQGSLVANKQVTTDVLAHRARTRHFKFDISVMYIPGVSIAGTNQAIHGALNDFFTARFFGSIVQLSDVLQVIHSVGGVDNVRWSSDVPNSPDTFRLQETDRFGTPLANVIIDRSQQASVARGAPDVQKLYITGEPTGGTFHLSYGANQTADPGLPYSINAAGLLAALQGITSNGITSVTGTGLYGDPFVVTFVGTATRSLLTASSLFTGGPTIYDSDFILKDDELPALPLEAQPGDTVPGLIIRPRAQNTWTKK